MSALSTLLKLAERRIEAAGAEVRRRKAARDAVDAELAVLEARVEAEAEAARHLVGFTGAYGAFIDRVRAQREILSHKRGLLDAEVKSARRDLQSAFEEKSRIELLMERETRRVRAEEARAQEKRLEDIALFRSARGNK